MNGTVKRSTISTEQFDTRPLKVIGGNKNLITYRFAFDVKAKSNCCCDRNTGLGP